MLKVVLALAGSLLMAGGVYGYFFYDNVKQTVNKKMHEPVETIDIQETEKKVKERESLHILLLGVDRHEGTSGRSDTMVVLTLDPTHDRMQMVSIPRDTRTTIEDLGTEDKINHAYAFGGTDMAVDTVETFLDISLDYYVRLNMEGMSQFIDSVGGITVENEFSFDHEDMTFEKGPLELNGREALGYVRMRKEDPQGDKGRNERQRQVIQAVIEKGTNITSVGKYGDILQVLGNNVSTNMSFSDMRNIAVNYRSSRENIETYQIAGEGQMIDDIYYLMVSDKEVEKVNQLIQKFES